MGRCCHSELSASFQTSHRNLFQGLSCNRGGDHRALCEPQLHWALVKEPGRAAAVGTACQVLVEQCGDQDAASRDLSKETFPWQTYGELMTCWNISAPVILWYYSLFPSTCAHTVQYKALAHPQVHLSVAALKNVTYMFCLTWPRRGIWLFVLYLYAKQ